jgi:type 1 glutamine amidotransferase
MNHSSNIISESAKGVSAPVLRGLSRRSALAAGLSAAVLFADRGFSQTKARALCLVGDRYHNSDYIRVGLDKVFTPLGIKADYTFAYDSISSTLLKPYDLFLILRDGMIWPQGYLGPDAYTAYENGFENKKDFPALKPEPWITEEQAHAIHDFVNAGKGFYPLHNSSNISVYSKTFRDVMGGAYIGHPTMRPFKVRITNHTHPITKDIQDFMVNDEQHYVAYDKDHKYLLAESDNIDGLDYEGRGTKSVAAWAYDYGKGRVVFTAVGHTIHALWVPQHLELQKRAVRWLLKEI